MKHGDRTPNDTEWTEFDEATLGTLPERDIPNYPLRITVSGLYATPGVIPGLFDEESSAAAGPVRPLPIPAKPLPLLVGEEMRLDVDGRYPLMIASGTVPLARLGRVHWIARLRKTAALTWTGGIWYKNPTTAPFAYTTIHIAVTPGPLAAGRTATVVFSGPALPNRVRTFAFRSPYFHKVEFEFDRDAGVDPVLAINTADHPNHPATIAHENLSIETVYRRAGFDVNTSPNVSQLPGAPGGTWSDAEMHDAMQVYWSRFANKAQWSMWVLLAKRHEMGSSLGGIMFDDIGPNHRQGTSIFYDSFISNPAPSDPAPDASRARMRFWTAVHEMGHAVNLAHSWQKALPVGWIPLADDPEARSFMNYPYRVAGGETTFFANFEYRFTNDELLFMRHAPGRFVEMGAQDWFDHHGFKAPQTVNGAPLELTLRFNRPQNSFEFLEPIVAEIKLKNVSNEPQMVDTGEITSLDRLTIALIRRGGTARCYVPYARRCMARDPRVLAPGESIYTSVFLSAGLNGFDLCEPGRYVMQAAYHADEGDVVCQPIVVKVAPPNTSKEEIIAQDVYTDEVGRALAFDGTRHMIKANDTLHLVSEVLGNLRVAQHARVALALPLTRTYSLLSLPAGIETLQRPAAWIGTSEADRQARIEATQVRRLAPDTNGARKLLGEALTTHPDVAAETLGHIDYSDYVTALADFIAREGQRKDAVRILGDLQKLLSARGVKETVLRTIQERKNNYETAVGA